MQQSPRNKRAYRFVGISAVTLAAMGVGYSIRGAAAQEQQVLARTGSGGAAVVYTADAPAVKGPSVQSAAALQDVFAEVARVSEPAVVTITTEVKAGSRRPGSGGAPNLRRSPGGPGFPNPFGGEGDPSREFEELFRRFRERERQPQPNAFKGERQYDDGHRMTQGVPAPAPGSPFVPTGVGSGFIYDAGGLIMTNAHVVAGADAVTVKLLDGREFKDAKVLGVDERTDIAVVKIPATNLPTVRFGDSGEVKVGDWAIAVGNPFGLSNTMTVGIISAKGREMARDSYSPGDYLQTDASINPGNSGGPLLDIYGRVIGVNNSIYSRSGGNVGIGFAIPITAAREVADTLARDGRVRRARIGTGITEVEDKAAAFGLPAGTKGVLVESVEPNGPAAKAGVQVGDVITSFNGVPVARPAELQRQVSRAPIGREVKLAILRGGETAARTLSITPTELAEEGAARRQPAPKPEPETPRSQERQPSALGLSLGAVTPALTERFRLPKDAAGGVAVMEVARESAAGRAGLQPGDLIRRVGQKNVATPEQVTSAVDAILKAQQGGQRGKTVALLVARGSESQYVIVTVTD